MERKECCSSPQRTSPHLCKEVKPRKSIVIYGPITIILRQRRENLYLESESSSFLLLPIVSYTYIISSTDVFKFSWSMKLIIYQLQSIQKNINNHISWGLGKISWGDLRSKGLIAVADASSLKRGHLTSLGGK